MTFDNISVKCNRTHLCHLDFIRPTMYEYLNINFRETLLCIIIKEFVTYLPTRDIVGG